MNAGRESGGRAASDLDPAGAAEGSGSPPQGTEGSGARLRSDEAQSPNRQRAGGRATGADRRSAVAWLRIARRKYQDDEASMRAMALTYTTILSLVPFLAVAFSVLKAFGVQNQLEPMLQSGLAPLGAEADELSLRIVEFVGNMRVGVLGALGVAGLFYTVLSLIGTIEASFNRIWQVREGRGWGEMFRDYLSAVMVGPVLVFAALALTASAQSSAVVQNMLSLVPSFVMVLITGILPYLLLSLAFTALYRLMPNTGVSLRAAAIGGVFAGVGWKLAGTAFTTFVAGSGRYAAIYSSFAILILFLIWVYLSWSITLVGAEIAYLVDHFREERERRRGERYDTWEGDALRLLALLTERHEAGLPPLPRAGIERELSLPHSSAEELMARLRGAGMILISAEPPGVALARPPARIRVAEALVAAARPPVDLREQAPDPIAEVLALRHRAGLRAVEDMTLEGLGRHRSSQMEGARRAS